LNTRTTEAQAGTAPVRRLFFALMPEAETLAALQHAVRALPPLPGGRPVAADRLHLTLLFLGMTPGACLPGIQAAAGRVRAAPFTLELERLGYWRHAGVLWLAPASCPPLIALHTGLRAEVALACPELIPELILKAREFRPHVTLMRGLRRPPRVPHALEVPLVWPVTGFALVASADTGYRVLGRWPLA
jgi:2'-5' RNA ligase